MKSLQFESFSPFAASSVVYSDVCQPQCTIVLILDDLRLNPGNHGRTSQLTQIGMRSMPHGIGLTALAVRHNGNQVGLCARGRKQSRFFTKEISRKTLQFLNRRIIVVVIIAHLRLGHGIAHWQAGSSPKCAG